MNQDNDNNNQKFAEDSISTAVEDSTSQTVEDSFEPWEQSNPIPLAFLVVLVSLLLVSVLYYANSYYPEHSRQAGDKSSKLASQASQDLPEAPSSVTAGNAVVWSCASCHGLDGMGSGQTPALAGLTADYLNKQLADFKELTRNNNSMQYVVEHSTSQELEQAVNYYAELERHPQKITYLGGFADKGELLATQGKPEVGTPPCSSCHAPHLASVFPSIEGQSADYIYSQLEAFKHGLRTNDAIMPNNVKNLSSEEMRDLAEYYHQQGRKKDN